MASCISYDSLLKEGLRCPFNKCLSIMLFYLRARVREPLFKVVSRVVYFVL